MSIRYGFAVLAGGAGKRMGRRNKANLTIGEESFLDRIASQVRRYDFPVYLSVARYEQTLPSGWIPVKDHFTDPNGDYVGPLGGIASCLEQAKEDGLDGLFFIPCDAPFYDSHLADQMLRQMQPQFDTLLIKSEGDRLQPAFGYYATSCLPVFEEAIAAGQYRLMAVVRNLRCNVLDAEEIGVDAGVFTNVNSPAEYESLKKPEPMK